VAIGHADDAHRRRCHGMKLISMRVLGLFGFRKVLIVNRLMIVRNDIRQSDVCDYQGNLDDP
jgi:hypothetical protein